MSVSAIAALQRSSSCTCLAAALLTLAMSARVLAAGIPAAVPDEGALHAIVDLVTAGQFKSAQAAIDAALQQPALTLETRTAFEFQHERMQRMRRDFSLDAAAAKAQVREQIPDLRDAEFTHWDAQGLLEHMSIDGERVYFNGSPAALFRLSEQARARRTANPAYLDSGLPTSVSNRYFDYDQRVIQAARASGKTHVLPQRVRVTQSVTVDADAVADGKTIRAWIPYPRAIVGQQQDIRFVASTPAAHRIAPESALQRTVFLERTSRAGKPSVFSITYEVTLFAQYHAIDGGRTEPATISADLQPFVAERAPHIVFTQPLRVFSRQVVGDETNPYRIAQKIYAAVDAIPWAGAREYSTIPDLSAYTLHAGHGDCGEQTLLLIALLRMNGIPARWQSGWTFTAGDYEDIHDWAQIYLAPYGWVPVDVTYGRIESSDAALRWFYLGGLDNFRIAFNDDFSRAFVPPKRFFRSDTVDSQRGEVESDDGNVYYDKWKSDFKWQILAPAH